jgi:hypothetical protein
MSRLFSLLEQKFSEVREMRILVRFTGASGEDGLGVEGRKVEVLFRLSRHTLGKCF